MRRGLVVAIVVGLGPGVPMADPARPDPIGSLVATGELALTGGKPRQRGGAAATFFVTHRLGVYASLARASFELDEGQVTGGVAYRAAIARPTIELVLHADVGVAWPTAPVAGGGVTALLWPTRLPIALATGLRSYAILDGLDHSRLAISLELGLALAR